MVETDPSEGIELHLQALRSAVDGLADPSLREELQGLSDAARRLAHTLSARVTSHDELRQAGRVQQGLLPRGPHALPGAVVHAWHRGSDDCSASWWVVRPLGEQAGLVVLGQVDARGPAAALIGSLIHGACSLAGMGMRARLRVGPLLRMLDRLVTDAGAHGSTAQALTFDESTHEVRLASAAHPAPLLRTMGHWGIVRGDPEPPLGASTQAARGEMALPTQQGDQVVLFTDGVLEVGEGQNWLLRACEEAGPDASGAELAEHLGSRLSGSVDSDATVLVVDIGAPAPRGG